VESACPSEALAKAGKVKPACRQAGVKSDRKQWQYTVLLELYQLIIDY
jgi:hypothetical protein